MKATILGFPVHIGADFFFVTVVLGASGGDATRAMLWVSCVLVSVLVHELGHAIVARRFGYRPWIRLHGMGGTTYYEHGDVVGSWRSEALISLAGPAAGFLLGGLVLVVARTVGATAGAAGIFVSQMLWVNVAWSVWNLFPVLPYDGGLAFRALARRIAPRRGEGIAHGVSVVLALAGISASLVYRQWWVAYLYVRAIGYSWQVIRAARFDRELTQAWAQWDAGELDAAQSASDRLVAQAHDDDARGRALELAMFLALRRCREDDARAAFDRYPEGKTPSALLRAVVAIDREDSEAARHAFELVAPALAERVLHPIVVAWSTATSPEWKERAHRLVTLPPCANIAMPLGAALFYARELDLSAALDERVFEAFRLPDAAYNAACSHARAGRLDLALDWLRRAIDAGFDDRKQLETDEDIDAIRGEPDFASLFARVAERE